MGDSLEAILARAITKIAHKACRNGENGWRAWPNLADLPEPEGWKIVGEIYAPQIAAEILKAYQPRLLWGILTAVLTAPLRSRCRNKP